MIRLRAGDAQFKVVLDAIRHLMSPPPEPQHRETGFQVKDDDDDQPGGKRR